jgi:seryl-tRNA synthetase
MTVEITIPLASPLSPPIKKAFGEMSYYLCDGIRQLEVSDNAISLRLQNQIDEAEELQIRSDVDDLLRTLPQEVEEGEDEVVRIRDNVSTAHEDPWPALVANAQVKSVAPGLVYLFDEAARSLERLDRDFFDIAKAFGCREAHYSTVLPIRSMLENRYLAGFPQHALFASTAHQSLKSIREIAARATRERQISSDLIASPVFQLAPTVCYHCFEALKSSKVAPGTMYTARCFCHRFESGNVLGLSRLHVFSMREIIFFGDPEFVETTRAALIERCCEYLAEKWNSKFRVTVASDPFFAGGAGATRRFQAMQRSKFELQMHIPHSDSWLSVMSFNNHLEKLTRKYGIGPAESHSGCFGVGYERLLFALLSQIGCRPFFEQIGA